MALDIHESIVDVNNSLLEFLIGEHAWIGEMPSVSALSLMVLSQHNVASTVEEKQVRLLAFSEGSQELRVLDKIIKKITALAEWNYLQSGQHGEIKQFLLDFDHV